MTVGDALGGKL